MPVKGPLRFWMSGPLISTGTDRTIRTTKTKSPARETEAGDVEVFRKCLIHQDITNAPRARSAAGYW